jgi:hypothetical protein
MDISKVKIRRIKKIGTKQQRSSMLTFFGNILSQTASLYFCIHKILDFIISNMTLFKASKMGNFSIFLTQKPIDLR